MKRFFKNRCVLGFLIIVIIFSVIVGVVNVKHPEATFGENLVNVTVTPIQSFFTWVGDGVSGFFGYFDDKDDLRKEIDLLKKENAKLKTAVSKNDIAMIENVELRKLLELENAYSEQELQFAEVISRDPSNWHKTFTIDMGSSDGIAVNQPVLSENNTLVGRICEVGTTWAKVITVYDPEHSVGAVVSRSGEYGIVEGDSDAVSDGNCMLSYISKKADVIVGDMVMTSGLGEIYPEGIIIGKVQKVLPDPEGTAKNAVVIPEADIENIRAVCIITNPKE